MQWRRPSSACCRTLCAAWREHPQNLAQCAARGRLTARTHSRRVRPGFNQYRVIRALRAQVAATDEPLSTRRVQRMRRILRSLPALSSRHRDLEDVMAASATSSRPRDEHTVAWICVPLRGGTSDKARVAAGCGSLASRSARLAGLPRSFRRAARTSSEQSLTSTRHPSVEQDAERHASGDRGQVPRARRQ